MTEIVFLMWLADVAGSIGVVGIVLSMCMGAGLVVTGANGSLEKDQSPTIEYLVRLKWWIVASLAVAVFIPSQATIRILAVARASDLAAQTAIGQKTVEAVGVLLDEVIKRKK